MIIIYNNGINAKPLIAVTVDVETTMYEGEVEIPLSEQYDLEKDGLKFGLSGMMDILEKNSVKGVFFYNVYEYMKERSETIKMIAKKIDSRGHDIELHTHPHWAYESDKVFMHDYDFEMQKEIIRDGKLLLEDWIDKKIIAHRAGAYGADIYTLKALEYNKIFLDSSYYYNHPWCRLNKIQDLLKKNYFSKVGPVIEVPVNVFYLDDVPKYFYDIKPLRHTTKYDINQYVEEGILHKGINIAIENNYDVIVLFLHSFSFIKYDKERNYIPVVESINKLESVIKYAKNKGLSFVTFRDLERMRLDNQIQYDKTDQISIIQREISTLKYIFKRMGGEKKDVPYVIAGLILISFFGYFLIIKIKKYR